MCCVLSPGLKRALLGKEEKEKEKAPKPLFTELKWKTQSKGMIRAFPGCNATSSWCQGKDPLNPVLCVPSQLALLKSTWLEDA